MEYYDSFFSRDKYRIYYIKIQKDKESIILKVKESDTIKNVKNKIENIKGVSVDSQELLFDEEKLEDQHTLSHYKITAGSTLTLQTDTSSHRSWCTVS